MQVTAPSRLKASQGKSPKQEGDCWSWLLQGHPRQQLWGCWCHTGNLCLVQDSTATLQAALSAAGAPCLTLSTHRESGEEFLAAKAVGKPCLRMENQENLPAVQPTHIFIHDQADYQWPLKNWSVSLFVPNLLGSLQIKGFQAKELPCWKALLSETEALPKHPKYICIAFPGAGSAVQPQSALYPHETQLRTDLKLLRWERQLTFPTTYSSVQLLKHTVSSTAQTKGTTSNAAWTSKHTRLPLKCPVSSLKGSITQRPEPEIPHGRTHGRAPLKAGFPLGLIRSADLAHPHPPRFHICNYHWKSHTSGTAPDLRPSFPMTG